MLLGTVVGSIRLRKIQSSFCPPEEESSIGKAASCCRTIAAGNVECGAGKTNQKSSAMATLYDLLGALPNDDADELRAAFRRAVKRAHPDVNSKDPDAGLKFRRIMRANEILSDVEQRAAYDHLLELAQFEQEEAGKRDVADEVRKRASGMMAFAGITVVVAGGFALFLYLTANAVTLASSAEQAVREPVAIVSASPDTEGAESLPIARPETPGEAETASAAVLAAKGAPNNLAGTVPSRVGRTLDRTPKRTPKFASSYSDRGIFLYRWRKFTHAFAELAQAEGHQRVGRSASGNRQRD